MLRDTWWWAWWVSSLIDLAVVSAALVVFRLSRHRTLRALAAAFVVAGLVAAALAPIVMTEQTDRRRPNEPAMPGESR
jgi:choline-glycine betaine transporter